MAIAFIPRKTWNDLIPFSLWSFILGEWWLGEEDAGIGKESGPRMEQSFSDGRELNGTKQVVENWPSFSKHPKKKKLMGRISSM